MSTNRLVNVANKDDDKLLGILWNSESDKFKFQINLNKKKTLM